MPDDTPHYHGHRQRLRERFLAAGPTAIGDYELIELLLFQVRPRGDVKPLAKSLLARFGSFAGIVNADIRELTAMPGMGETSAVALKVVQAAAHRLLKEEVMDRPVLTSWQQVVDYCRVTMGHTKTEAFRLLFLDRRNALIADEVQQTGTVDHTPLYPREVVKRSLELGASAIIMVHNHPSGDPTPSKADIAMTRAVAAAAAPLGVELHDHLIIGRVRHTSFRGSGLLEGLPRAAYTQS